MAFAIIAFGGFVGSFGGDQATHDHGAEAGADEQSDGEAEPEHCFTPPGRFLYLLHPTQFLLVRANDLCFVATRVVTAR